MYASAFFPGRHKRMPGRVGTGLLAAALLLISGCATRQGLELPDISNWDARQSVLGEIDAWEFSGRIGISAGTEGFNGKLRWRQRESECRVTVSGPLGFGTVRIESSGATVVHTDKRGVRTVLDDAEAELRLRYGWTIPVRSLRYWALGIPDPSAPAETRLNADGQLEALAQRDWTVMFARYRKGGGQLMPNRLTAVNADTRVRLVIDHWSFLD